MPCVAVGGWCVVCCCGICLAWTGVLITILLLHFRYGCENRTNVWACAYNFWKKRLAQCFPHAGVAYVHWWCMVVERDGSKLMLFLCLRFFALAWWSPHWCCMFGRFAKTASHFGHVRASSENELVQLGSVFPNVVAVYLHTWCIMFECDTSSFDVVFAFLVCCWLRMGLLVNILLLRCLHACKSRAFFENVCFSLQRPVQLACVLPDVTAVHFNWLALYIVSLLVHYCFEI